MPAISSCKLLNGAISTAVFSVSTLIFCASAMAQSAQPNSRPRSTVASPDAGAASRSQASVAQRSVAQRAQPPRDATARSASTSKARPTTTGGARQADRAQPADRASNAPRTPRARTVVAATAGAAAVVAVPTIGRAIGLHQVADPLALRSSVALMVDQQSGQVIYQKNADAVLPIASITKVMTAMVVLDSAAPLGELLEVTEADRDTERHSSSRLPIGSRVSRGDMLLLALMSSENRAANALGRHHAEGLAAFVAAMNAKARALGLNDTRFTEPTGLSGGNVSSARDLARLTAAAYGYPLIRDYSTSNGRQIDVGRRQIGYRSTNRLIDHPHWDIGLQKTGYISEAGKCLVMQATVQGREVIIVLLDAAGSQSRFADAERLRRWLKEPESNRAVDASQGLPSNLQPQVPAQALSTSLVAYSSTRP